MAITVLLIAVLVGIAGWWLSGQRLTAKPWLETGDIDDRYPGTGALKLPAAKLGLIVFLAVVGSLFALFFSAYPMRMGMGDWRPLPLPRLLWLNTGVLIASSVALERARRSARGGRIEAVRLTLLVGGGAALLFLAGQLLAWRQLAAVGLFLDNSPAAAFFYLLTAVHGLHILGGLVALGRTIGRVGYAPGPEPLRLSVELCALYWHFLLLVWLVLFAVLLFNVGHVHGAMH